MNARVHLGAGAPIVRLRWVYTDQPFLPVGTQSVINNRIWNEDQDSELSVGQLPLDASQYVQDERYRLPAGMRPGHMCHPEWFSVGEPWPTALPPAVYGPNWIPECCGLFQDSTEGGMEVGGEVGDTHTVPDATEGGMEIGGEVGDVFRPPDATEGGMEIGGEVGDVFRPPDATEGGMEIGGEVGDVFTPPSVPCPTPTATCAAATVGALNVSCDVLFTGPSTRWRMWQPGTGATVRVRATVLSSETYDYTLYEGTDCGSLSVVASGFISPAAPLDTTFVTTAPRVYLELTLSFAVVLGDVQVRCDLIP